MNAESQSALSPYRTGQPERWWAERILRVDGIYYLRVLAAFALCLLPLSTVLYFPLVKVGGSGTVTFNDAWLIVIWVLTSSLLLAKSKLTRNETRALYISGLSILPCFLGVVGALTYDASSPVRSQFFMQFKYLGEASIATVSLLLCSESQKQRVAKCAVLAGILLVVIPLTPVADWLPKPDNVIEFEGRYTGTIFNPNDFAAISVFVMCIALGGVRGRWAWLWKGLALAVAGGAIVSSASRAAVVAVFVVVVWTAKNSRASVARKGAIFAALAIAVGSSLLLVSSYRNRMDSAFGSKTVDDNFAGRVDAQIITTNTALHYPLGVGIVNFPVATQEFNSNSLFNNVDLVYTSDSLYCDYFLGSGLAGLLAVLALFVLAWRIIGSNYDKHGRVYLQAGLLGAAAIALASLTPATAFASPFFFLLIGMSTGVTNMPSPSRKVMSGWSVVSNNFTVRAK